MHVYVVVGIWEGLLEDIEVYTNQDYAFKVKQAIKKKYDIRADKLDDEPEENMNYQVTVNERII